MCLHFYARIIIGTSDDVNLALPKLRWEIYRNVRTRALFLLFREIFGDNTSLLSLAPFVSYWFPIKACLNSFGFNGTRMGRVCLCKFEVNCFEHLKQLRRKKLVVCV